MSEIAAAPVPAPIAATGAPAGAVKLGALFSLLRRRLARRRDMRLLALYRDDCVLRDVGVSRAEALREYRKPLWKA